MIVCPWIDSLFFYEKKPRTCERVFAVGELLGESSRAGSGVGPCDFGAKFPGKEDAGSGSVFFPGGGRCGCQEMTR